MIKALNKCLRSLINGHNIAFRARENGNEEIVTDWWAKLLSSTEGYKPRNTVNTGKGLWILVHFLVKEKNADCKL
jgi:hypothetical protein